jgi:hypothetical protein
MKIEAEKRGAGGVKESGFGSRSASPDTEERQLTVGLDQVLELGEVRQLVITGANHFGSRKGGLEVSEESGVQVCP